MTDLNHTIDRAAARLTHAEPRPDVRARVLASMDTASRTTPWISWRVAVATAAAAALVVVMVLPKTQRAQVVLPALPSAVTPAPVTIAAQNQTSAAAPTTVAAAKKPRAPKPAAPEYVSPTPLPAIGVDAIETRMAIQPTPFTIPQLRRNSITPGLVTSTVLDENGSNRDR